MIVGKKQNRITVKQCFYKGPYCMNKLFDREPIFFANVQE